MLNDFYNQFKPALAFETAVADGGGGGGAGAATAAPAGGAGAGTGTGAGAGAAPAGGAGRGSAGSGFFTNLPQKDLSDKTGAGADPGAAAAGAKTPAGAPQRFVVNDDAGKPIPGAEFDTEDEAKAFIASQAKGGDKTPEEAAAGAKTGEAVEVNLDAPLKQPLFNRFKTLREVEAGLLRSEQEGVRLAQEVKKLRAEADKVTATRETDVAALRAELELARKTPPFKELTKEEYSKLVKDDPEAALEYRFTKEKREQETEATRKDAERKVSDRRQRLEAVNAEIQRHDQEMRTDKTGYPMFNEVHENMEKILEITGGDTSPFKGQGWGGEGIYLMALGNIYRGLLQKGEITKKDATIAAKKTAEATAAATSGTGAGSGKGAPRVKTEVELEHERWSKGIDAQRPMSILGGLKD